jgi:putative transposase
MRGVLLLMDLGQRMATVKFLIRGCAGQFTGSFDTVFTAVGSRILACPPQAPRANVISERIIAALRRELLDRLLIVNQQLTAYMTPRIAFPSPTGRGGNTGIRR